MSFNGSGTYVRTYSWTVDAANGVFIRSDRMDADTNDIASGLTNCICKDGQSTTSAAIPFAVGIKVNDGSVGTPAIGFTAEGSTGLYRIGTGSVGISAGGTLSTTFTATGLTSAAITGTVLAFAQGTNIASASTTDIGAATGNYVNITGTTSITALGTIAAGAIRFVNFVGILTLTYNATSLILPGAANITTAAGDTATFVSLGSGNWKCIQYQTQGNTPGGGFTASSVATLTNKTYDTAGAGNVFKINGTAVSAVVGTGAVVLSTAAVQTVKQQSFTSSGTYTPSTGMLYCVVETWGGGGGGGGVAANGGVGGGGGGGGAGSYSRHLATAATIGASKAIAIGTAGSAGTTGNNAGGNGGDTTLGSTIVVGKGGTGGAGSAGSATLGGAGGVAGTGNMIAAPGMPGSNSSGITVAGAGAIGGTGGSGMAGAGGIGALLLTSGNSDGTAGTGKGSGGSGGQQNGSGTGAAGGAGTAGLVVITEFCNQ